MAAYVLSLDAEADIGRILEYTFDSFGKKQMLKYQNQLDVCITRLAKKEYPYRTIEIESAKVVYAHCQYHYIFGLIRDGLPLYVFAVLHERMDLLSRVKERLG